MLRLNYTYLGFSGFLRRKLGFRNLFGGNIAGGSADGVGPASDDGGGGSCITSSSVEL